MTKVILATGNKGKIAELRAILSPMDCIAQGELGIADAEETGLTFIENAIIKARHASDITNMPALADDSGLVVAALSGQPGIYSSRFAGSDATDESNIDKLLFELNEIPDEHRHAYFYCACVFMRYKNDPTPIIATGRFDGVITKIRSGANGFGYDPVFYIPELKITAAQLAADIKNKISHRAKALESLKEQLSYAR